MCDPYFPLIRDDDYAVSKALYDKQLSQHYTDLDLKIKTEKGLYLFNCYLFIVINKAHWFRKIIKIKKTNSANFHTSELTGSW